MAAVPPIHHRIEGTLTTATSGGGQGLALGRAIPTSSLQTLRVRAWVWQTSTSKASYLDYVILAKNVAGVVTIIAPTSGIPAAANPRSDLSIVDDDAALSIEATVSGTQVRVEANQASASSRIWNFEIEETTTTPA